MGELIIIVLVEIGCPSIFSLNFPSVSSAKKFNMICLHHDEFSSKKNDSCLLVNFQ